MGSCRRGDLVRGSVRTAFGREFFEPGDGSRLKLRIWPNSLSARHWHGEIVAFQANAKRRFSPSIRQKLDLEALYADAVKQISVMASTGHVWDAWLANNPFTLDQLLAENWDDLVQQVAASTAP